MLNKMLLAICFFITLINIKSTAQTIAPKLVTTVEGFKEYELKNGLHVILMPDASQTNIAVNIVYKVGSRHEGYGESGMAHLLEHMLFKQCKKFADIKKAIADKGAQANGTTWYDRTNYYEILSSSDENLKWALDMEADRMVNSKILATELAKEFSVVRNEFEIGENDPGGVLQERVLSAMYLWHNYGKSTIGSKEDIERVKADNLRAFYKKYYQPDNAVLIIAGKFDEAKALQYTQQFFGPIPRPTRVLQPTYTVEPSQDGERKVELRRTGDIQYVAMAYHTPSVADKDFTANQALIQVLTNNPSGIMYKNLVETKLATGVYGYAQTLYDPGFTYFQCEVSKDRSVDSAKQVFLNTADGVSNMTITDEDLTRAKNKILKNIEDATNDNINLAITLTEYIGAGDWRLWFLNRDRIEKLTVADLQAVAKKYYKPSNRTYGVFVPDIAPDRTVVNETPDIQKMLQGYTGKVAAVQKSTFENSIANIKANTEYGRLSNGGKYALLQKPVKGDKITATISLRFGNETSLTDKSEVAGVLAELLKTGTTTKSKKEIADELDKIKSRISFGGGPGVLNVNISTDKQNLPKALALLDDILHHPKFDSTEFEKIILENKASYEANRNEPQSLVFLELNKKLSRYPKGHPLYAASTDESLEELNKITLADVKKYYADFYGADHSASTFVGELDKKVITDFLQNSLGKWNSKTTFAEIEPKYFETKASTEVINTPDKTNAVMGGGFNLNISRKNPDYPALLMSDQLLGGGAFLSSRIPKRLRESEGMSYGAGSFINVEYKYNNGTWGMYAFFNPIYKGRLDSALRQEIDKALKDGFTAEELKNSVNSFMEQNKTVLGSNDNLAGLINAYMINERDLTQFTDFETKIKALDVNAVNAALKKYFDTNKLVLIYGGDFNKNAAPDKKGF